MLSSLLFFSLLFCCCWKVEWPEPFQTLSSVFSIAQLNFAEVVPVGCVTRMSFYSQVFAATLVPIAAVALVHLASFLPVHMPKSRDTLLSRGSAIYWSQLISFLVLPSTSLVLFKVFICEQFPPLNESGSLWLAADLEYSCESDTYRGMLAYTIIMLFVYPIGIPCYFCATLYPKRDKIKALDRSKPVPAKLRKCKSSSPLTALASLIGLRSDIGSDDDLSIGFACFSRCLSIDSSASSYNLQRKHKDEFLFSDCE